jgi:putative colanic acid biosynthesis acetyltransferase WcaF
MDFEPGRSGRFHPHLLSAMTRQLQRQNLSLANKAGRLAWAFVWAVLYRPSPRYFHAWRRLLLRCFGAQLGVGVHPYPSSRVWAPWNLQMGDHSCLSEGVDCYCVAKITIGKHSTVSQYSFLCSASHDYTEPDMPMTCAPIAIGDQVWITADVFVGPGVSIGNGAVITARSSVFSDIPSWVVARGNPATPFKRREIKGTDRPQPYE